jgi:hypothetical protein
VRTEPANGHQGVLADGQVAARQMLGLAVVEQNMHRCTRCGSDHGFGAVARWRRDVRAACGHPLRIIKSLGKVVEPVRFSQAVVVGVGEDFPRGEPGAQVARGTQTGMFLAVVMHEGKVPGDGGDILG